MIPLSQWLAERHPPQDAPRPAEAVEEHMVLTPEPECDLDESIANAVAQREEELLTAVREAEAKLEQQALSHAARERELEARLGAELGRRLQSEISSAFEGLLTTIEESLAQLLAPFLTEQARIRATADLMDLIRRDMQQSEAPLIEIRAPAGLHDAMRCLGDEAGIAVTDGSSDIVELVFSTDRRRFEDLSARWVETIGGQAR